MQARFPCRITLVAATNPCPCGWHGVADERCTCLASQRRSYWARLSGPLLDRLDLQVVVQPVEASQLRRGYASGANQSADAAPEASQAVMGRVIAARERMRHRNTDGLSNGCLPGHLFRRSAVLDTAALNLWEQAIEKRRLSSRAAERSLRVAQTIADLREQSTIGPEAIAEALGFRSFDLPA
jgi:magnesium chelatase family protein